MTKQTLIFRYALFAVAAIAVNLLVQRMVLSADFGDRQLVIAIAFGTAAGLIVKYVLDKFWVFADYSLNASRTGKQFFLYIGTGVLTTAIFWGAEFLSWFIWRTELARECGAVLGLTVGYLYKFRLDSKYVFSST